MNRKNVLLVAVAAAVSVVAFWQVPLGARPIATERFSVVAIDAGHTSERPGATSARGRHEYDFNTRLASELLTALHHAGFSQSFLIDPKREGLSDEARLHRAAGGGADLMLSIHHDSVQPHYLREWHYDGQTRQYCDRFAGYSLFVSDRSGKPRASRLLSRLLGEEMLAAGMVPTLHHAEAIAGESRELVAERLGIYRFDNLAMLRRSPVPAVLIECGVIVNRDEEARLSTAGYRQKIVAAIVTAVRRFDHVRG